MKRFGTLVISTMLLAGAGTAAGATLAAGQPSADPPVPHGHTVAVTRYAAPDAGVVNLQATPVEDAVATADPQALMVTFWSGSPGCHGLHHVDVEETPDAVTVRVITGVHPTFNVCTQEALRYAAEVHLAAPLDDRPIIDATTR